ncbi:MAG: hypothetical protein Q8R15_03240 [Candidatus Micrarchaeota archaeon]|nr:hypothetical protein [Candidatus Micrarchaeota archaeon]
MNALTLTCSRETVNLPSGATILVSFVAGKVLSSFENVAFQERQVFEAGELVLVRVLENSMGKPLRLSDLSIVVPEPGDLLVCLVGANASFKLDVIEVPRDSTATWIVVNRAGLVGQPVFGVADQNALLVKYVATLMLEKVPLKLVDRLPVQCGFEKPIIAVIGTDTNTGKTVTTAKLISELKQLGVKVGACKLTGICGDDPLSYFEAGADQVVDFSDAGRASTICNEQLAVEAALKCISYLQSNDVIVAEFGSSLLGQHPILPILSALNSAKLKVVVCGSEATAALGAMFLLSTVGVQPALFSGIMANSELACKILAQRTEISALSVNKQLIPSLLFEEMKNVETC